MMARSRRKKPHQPPIPPSYLEPVQGPTEAAQAHQPYERVRMTPNGPRVFQRAAPSLLDVLLRNRSITRQQADAGKRFAEDHRIIWGSSGARDSCVQRIGGEVYESETQADAIVRAKQRHNRVLNRIGPAAYALLKNIAVHEDVTMGRSDTVEGARRYRLLRHALDTAADVYGVAGSE